MGGNESDVGVGKVGRLDGGVPRGKEIIANASMFNRIESCLFFSKAF